MDKRMLNREVRAKQVKRTKFNIIVILTLLIINCTIICFSLFVSAEETHIDSGETYYYSIEISANDTLWDIAKEYKNDITKSTKEYVEEIMELNNMKSDMIYEGQYLLIASNTTL